MESAGLGVWVGNPVPTDVLQVQIAPLRSAPMSALPESSLHGLARGKMPVFSLTLYWKNQNQNASFRAFFGRRENQTYPFGFFIDDFKFNVSLKTTLRHSTWPPGELCALPHIMLFGQF